MISRVKICAVVAAVDARSMWRQVRRALGVTRTIELRLDWLSDDAEISKLLARLRVSQRVSGTRATLIATCRRAEGGGKLSGQSRSNWFTLPRRSARAAPGTTSNRDVVGMSVGIAGCAAARWPSDDLGAFLRPEPTNLDGVAASWRPPADAIKIAAQCNSLAETMKCCVSHTGGKTSLRYLWAMLRFRHAS